MRILLAYSGDSLTTTAIEWLHDEYHAEVVTATIDLGTGRALEAVRDQALAAGAVRAHVLDARDQFARDFILPSLKAEALQDDRFAMAIPLSRPLIARALVDIAEIEQADAIAHGANRRNGIAPALHVLLQSLKPALRLIEVPSSPPATRRAGCIDLPLASDEPTEANLWGRVVPLDPSPRPRDYPEAIGTTGGPVAAPAAAAVGDSGRGDQSSDSPGRPNEPAEVEITFDRGVPVAINGVGMPLLELIASLSTIAGPHRVGRAAAGGRLSEAPAAIVLHAAHQRLQARAIPGDLQMFARAVSLKYVDLVCDGLWFSPLREALDAFVDKVQERVTGGVRLTLFNGNVVKH